MVKPPCRRGISHPTTHRRPEETTMRTSKQKVLRLAAGSLIAACSMFGTAALADEGGDGGGKDPAPNPPPGGPTIPKNPGEGLPIPLPGGGG
jgi:hypothetical protein